MTEWISSTCKSNGINIHYTRTGGTKPPLILLHGLTGNGACWTTIANALQTKYDVIMPDARGHGKSSAPDNGYLYEDHANDIAGLIKALKISAPILIGHSMGGMTAAVAASREPKLIRSLILADPTFLSPKVQREVHESDVADQHRRLLNTSFYELVTEAHIKHPNRSLAVLEQIASARLQASINAFEVLTPPNPDYKHLVSIIDVPSLLVFGDSGVVSLAEAEEVQRLNPKFQIKQIAEAGHGLHYDQPERFAEVVKSFLLSLMKS